ncbi:hypothetical protein XOCgx_3734 [Xanthomonas oryzae pv. oryzicola]|nr:hypothetical protein XOCgx_3734 [Xanthomonas oryzae pv. oryzicola]
MPARHAYHHACRDNQSIRQALGMPIPRSQDPISGPGWQQ